MGVYEFMSYEFVSYEFVSWEFVSWEFVSYEFVSYELGVLGALFFEPAPGAALGLGVDEDFLQHLLCVAGVELT